MMPQSSVSNHIIAAWLYLFSSLLLSVVIAVRIAADPPRHRSPPANLSSPEARSSSHPSRSQPSSSSSPHHRCLDSIIFIPHGFIAPLNYDDIMMGSNCQRRFTFLIFAAHISINTCLQIISLFKGNIVLELYFPLKLQYVRMLI